MVLVIKYGTYLFTNIWNTVLMVLHALQELLMFYGVRVQLLAFQRLLLLQYPLFLTLFNFTCGVAFPEHPLKMCYIYYD